MLVYFLKSLPQYSFIFNEIFFVHILAAVQFSKRINQILRNMHISYINSGYTVLRKKKRSSVHSINHKLKLLCASLKIGKNICIFGCTLVGAPVFTDPNLRKRSFRAWPASHSIRLKCQAIGALPLKYKWLKDGKDLKKPPMDATVNTPLWYLQLQDLVPTDSGRYTCIVSNSYGSIRHTFTLQVVGKNN